MDIFDKFRVERNAIVDCACGWSYVPLDDEDRRNHAAHHAEFERVTTIRSHVPHPYRAREHMKDEGRRQLRGAATDAEALAGAEMIVRAYFDRSFARSIELGFGDLHPSMPEYALMLANDPLFDARAGAILRRRYAHVSVLSGVLESTIWDPDPCQIGCDSPIVLN